MAKKETPEKKTVSKVVVSVKPTTNHKEDVGDNKTATTISLTDDVTANTAKMKGEIPPHVLKAAAEEYEQLSKKYDVPENGAAPSLPADFDIRPTTEHEEPNSIKDFVAEGRMRMSEAFTTFPPDKEPEFAPYDGYRSYGQEGRVSKTLLDQANKLARDTWGDVATYSRTRGGIISEFSTTPRRLQSFTELDEVRKVNAEYYDHWFVSGEIRTIFSPQSMGGGSPHDYQVQLDIDNLIRKLKRLERKHDNEDLISDDARERIIENILLPPNVYGISSNYHGYGHLDLSYPVQKAVVNELLTTDEMRLINNILHYIVRSRVILMNFDYHGGRLLEEDVLRPLIRKSKDIHGFVQHAMARDWQEDKKMITALKKMSQFLITVVPDQVQRDFLTGKGVYEQPTKASLKYQELQKASGKMREAALEYIQETGKLSDLLSEIVEFAGALAEFFQQVNTDVKVFFDFLNSAGVAYPKLVEESEQLFRDSEIPW